MGLHSIEAAIVRLTAKIFSLLLSSRTVNKLNPSSAYARDFATTVSSEGLSSKKKPILSLENYLKLFSVGGA